MTITPFVKEILAEEESIKEFKEQTFQLADFIKPKVQIENEVKGRWLKIEQEAKKLLPEPTDYRE